jgi:hypothetical protein
MDATQLRWQCSRRAGLSQRYDLRCTPNHTLNPFEAHTWSPTRRVSICFSARMREPALVLPFPSGDVSTELALRQIQAPEFAIMQSVRDFMIEPRCFARKVRGRELLN